MVFLECFKCVLPYETRNSSHVAQSGRFFGWITIAEKKLVQGENRKRKGIWRGGGGGEEEKLTLPPQESYSV